MNYALVAALGLAIGLVLGKSWGVRSTRSWFIRLVAEPGEIASMTYPETPHRLRRVNGYFSSWMKTAERVELAKGQAPKRFIAELNSLAILTAAVAVTAKKLHEAAHAELLQQCEDLNAIKQELHPGPEISPEGLLSEANAEAMLA